MTVVSALTIRIGLPSGETYTPEDGLVGFWLDDDGLHLRLLDEDDGSYTVVDYAPDEFVGLTVENS
jgi:hypothetical protein